jgi:hypothetical protein
VQRRQRHVTSKQRVTCSARERVYVCVRERAADGVAPLVAEMTEFRGSLRLVPRMMREGLRPHPVT